MCKRYIYLRVSTDSQGFEQQMQDIKAYGINPKEVDGIVEEHESGGKSYVDREFQKLLDKCEMGDMIYAASTDRLGRSFTDMVKLMAEAKDRGITIIACKQDLKLSDDSLTTKLIISIMALIDEDERMRIKHRTANKKAWQREQIAKHGYFIVERGPNKGQMKRTLGAEKGADTSAAIEASALSRQNAAIAWRDKSVAVRFAVRKRAEGWTLQQIADEIGQLYDAEQAKTRGHHCLNSWGTPTGKKPSRGTISVWLRDANPLAMVI